jgi:peptidoglycan/xylan/chitin deacetylase (PgdA/CDA1 family)
VIHSRLFSYSIAAIFAVLIVATTAIVGYQTFWDKHASVTDARANPGVVARQVNGGRIAILRSEATAQFLHSGAAYESHPQYWHSLLTKAGWPSDLISDEQLETGLSGYRVLVLPSAVCLSKKQQDTIRAFLEAGNGVIATWTTGSRDERGNWLGWQFLEEITGSDAFEIPDQPAPWYVSFIAGSPITAGIPAGSRIQLQSPERLSATALAVDGYWSNFRLFPVDTKKPVSFLGSVRHHWFDHKGRVVWFGFQENSAVAGGTNRSILSAALLSGVTWAAGDLLIGLDPWPAPYSSATLLALSVEQTADNARYAADALLKSRAKGSFFFLADYLRRDSSLIPALQGAGEISSHGWHQVSLESFNKFHLWSELLRSRWQIRQLTRQEVCGFSPVYDSLPASAVPVLAGARYRYYLGHGEGNSVLPQIVDVSAGWGPIRRQRSLVRLVRMGDDDLSLSPLGLTGLDDDWIVQRILADADVVNSLGGLYVLSYHSQGLSAPAYSSVLTRLVEAWKQQSTWIATGADVTDWWVKRQQLSINIAKGSTGWVRLTVDYAGREPIEGAVLSIYSPTETPSIAVTAVQGNPAKPDLVLDSEHQRVQIRLPRLVPGNYVYELR